MVNMAALNDTGDYETNINDYTINNKLKVSSHDGSIIIGNNSDLSKFSTSGNGTQSNPYTIEDKEIDGLNRTYGIFINNTNKYFSIVNCTIYNVSYGIFLQNVTNGYLADNILYNNSITAISFSNTNKTVIYKNTITGSLSSVIEMYNCHENSIIYNTLRSDYIHGIILNNSYRCQVVSNILNSESSVGLLLHNSNENNVTDNSISSHNYAIFLFSSNYTQIVNNFGIWNNFTIMQINCMGNFLENNFVYDNVLRDNSIVENMDQSPSIVYLDFTVILLSCLVVSISFFILKKKVVKASS